MAFMGMVIIVLAAIYFFMILTLVVLTLIFKIVGRKKESKKLKIVGNVFLVLVIIFTLPVIAITIYQKFNENFRKLTFPDGKRKYVRTWQIEEMYSYIKEPDENSLSALEKFLDENPGLVFYYDYSHEGILDKGLNAGNLKIVKIALEHGAIFDNPKKYNKSMDSYLGSCLSREITEDDIEILKILFENNVSTELKLEGNTRHYSNVFGQAVYAVLYNDKAVTDLELEFIQIFIDNGFSSDREFVPKEKDSESPLKVKNINYKRLMEIIGK